MGSVKSHVRSERKFFVEIKMQISVCLLALSAVSVSSFGMINRISLRPSECNNCGMTALGQLNVKVCGGAPGNNCCAAVNIANFENLYEGSVYDFTGQHELEDCFDFSLQKVSTLTDLGLVVYHEGSDGGQLDWIEVATSDGSVVRCTLGQWMDEFSSVYVDPVMDCTMM